MNYKIILNIPNEPHPTEVLLSEEKFLKLEPDLQLKRLVKINGSYFNTTYIAKIIPDIEANSIEMPNYLQLEETTKTTSDIKTKEELDKLTNKLKDKFIWKTKK